MATVVVGNTFHNLVAQQAAMGRIFERFSYTGIPVFRDEKGNTVPVDPQTGEPMNPDQIRKALGIKSSN